jgi:hypothetical protein
MKTQAKSCFLLINPSIARRTKDSGHEMFHFFLYNISPKHISLQVMSFTLDAPGNERVLLTV